MGNRAKDIETRFFTPRDYQLELLSYGIDHNTIVTLGTGSGKTFIAVLLINEYAFRLLNNNEKAIFIVDKVALVEQQAAHIECHSSLRVARMHGALNSSWTEKEKFLKFIDKYEVVVVTAQVILDLIDHAFFDLSTAALLIFDECHHALGKRHPFRRILDRYRKLPPEKSARILGLTASVINRRVNLSRLEITLNRFERIMCSRLEAVNELVSIFKYGAKPKQFLVKCEDRKPSCVRVRETLLRLRNLMYRYADFLPDHERDPRPIVREAVERILGILNHLGAWCAWRTCSVYHKRILQTIDDPMFGPRQKRFLKMVETSIATCIRMLANEMSGAKTLEHLKNFTDSRLLRLLDILRVYSPTARETSGHKDSMCALVFVHERFVAYCIDLFLKNLAKLEPASFDFIHSHFIVGHSGRYVDTNEASVHSKQQDAVLQRFRSGALNLLVVTSVLEEGIDVRQCSLVVRFDEPLDFRSFIQSRGRARKDDACFFILTYESTYQRLVKELGLYTQIEEFFMKYLKNDDIPSMSGHELSCVDNLIPPYIVEKTGARVTMSSAIALVNRYCSKLPSDIFTRLVPQVNVIPIKSGSVINYRAEIIFPINSPVKEAITIDEAYVSKSQALMAVALKACRILHERRELNDYLMPTGKNTVANLLHELDDEEYLPWRATTNKKRRLYDRRMSRSVVGTLPQINASCYVYVIEMKLTKPISEENNPKKRRILDPAEISSAFGFLSKTVLPLIPDFPIYQRQGEMQVRIRRCESMIEIKESQMNLIKLFHSHIFDDILRVGRGGLEFAPEYSPMPFLVVPLKKADVLNTVYNYVLDEAILSETIRSKPKVPSEEVRRQFKFNEYDFLNAVVMPWYRTNDQLSYYYVADICHDETPASSFPDEKFKSFNHYFEEKYKLTIFDQSQCLLDVDHTSARMNLLLPRISSQRTLKRSLDPTQRHRLVPELVHIHHLSSSYWTMLIALPTIFYRLNSLLLADELRTIIVREAFKAENDKLPDDFEWEALSYPTPTNETASQPIKNLEQLKRIISAEEREKTRLTADNKLYEEDEDVNEQTFEIGVWNPADAQEFSNSNDVTMSSAVQSRRSSHNAGGGGKRGDGSILADESINEAMAMGGYSSSALNTNDLMSDDEDVAPIDTEEYEILMDMKHSMHEKLAHLRGPVELSDNVNVVGWEDNEILPANIRDGANNYPLAVSGNSKEINIDSLMRDLETNFVGFGKSNSTSNTGDNKTSATASGRGRRRGPQKNFKAAAADVFETMEGEDSAANTTSAEQKGDSVNLIDYDDGSGTNDEENDMNDNNYYEAAISKESVKFTNVGGVPELHLNAEYFTRREALNFNRKEDLSLDIITKAAKAAVDYDCADIDLALVEEKSFEITAPKITNLNFSFDADWLSDRQFGVSPTLLLQALTTSSSGDGINLERLETIGDSFLKLAVTNYLYHLHPDQDEGKLSFARSKEVSNRKLFALGRKHQIPYLMEASKFDPHVNWLPPGYASNTEFHAIDPAELEEEDRKNQAELENNDHFVDQTTTEQPAVGNSNKDVKEKDEETTGWGKATDGLQNYSVVNGVETITFTQKNLPPIAGGGDDDLPPLPYNMLTQQYVADKSIADAVEALIGAHLIYLGPQGALKFMDWLGIKVLTKPPLIFSPLLRFVDTSDDPNKSKKLLFVLYRQFNFEKVEESINYRFGNKAYLVQAFTHASYYRNRITGCYQRLEFLGDAVLDYLITRFFFEHKQQYSPGVLTDLRSALVNNTIFASLAVKYGFHKHFIAMCPGLYHMIEKFVNLCKSRGDSSHCTNFDDELFMVTEEDVDEGHEEDVEVPKALGDIFESIAGAIYLDCGMKLDVVWRVFYNLMRDSIEECCRNPPQSPVRELFERKNYKARFSKLERIIETGKVRVTVDVSDMRFVGMGRSYRIAKSTAAKRALQYLKKLEATSISAKA